MYMTYNTHSHIHTHTHTLTHTHPRWLHLFVSGEQLEVAGRGDVVVTLEHIAELDATRRHLSTHQAHTHSLTHTLAQAHTPYTPMHGRTHQAHTHTHARGQGGKEQVLFDQ